MQANVQQRDAGRLRVFDLGDLDESPLIGAPEYHGDLALGRDPVLGTAQHRVLVRARRNVARDPAAVDDVNRRGPARGVALDPVAGPADNRVDGGVECDERSQRRVREAVARSAGREHLAHQRNLEQRLVRPRDADGHGLRLVLDRVDRAGELLDRLRERGGEILHDRARCADLPEVDLVRVERHDPDRVAQERRELHRGSGFERTVVITGAQTVEEPGGQRLELTRERGQRVEITIPGRCRRRADQGLDAAACGA